jgi:hypothetical protein
VSGTFAISDSVKATRPMGDRDAFTSGCLDYAGRVRHECIEAWVHFRVYDLEVEEE